MSRVHLAEGLTQREIGEIVGAARRTIGCVVTGLSWSRLTGVKRRVRK